MAEESIEIKLKKLARYEDKSRFICLKCGEQTSDFFILKDHIWKTINPAPHGKGLMHIACAESVLGRDFVMTDFKDVPGNLPIFLGYRIAMQENQENN